ncbi:type II toxin-antitoxin system RelB/DinJ family antitoxin [Raoultibacter phocaeensis]|uniref:type II toxin-antitoxin system RelB/DinJ family antitoxin n=1 Tax=Raoultibacter phocaeensis TaxID=2479841 RepID=UPI00111AFA80|nr:type II toxin-antitoxin system RelB/DinJ family antitoxin [Raoultibacter phocaeensis]
MGMATLNVRMPEDLKRNGDRVLEREGVSVSDAVRGLYRYLEDEQKVPEWLIEGTESKDDVFERRRRALRQLVGIVSLPPDFDFDAVRHERLMRKTEPGVRV